MQNNFELFMCCLGNGITVCNKDVYENSGYKQIAHISEHGVIKFYVPKRYIPEEAMHKIKNAAMRSLNEFMKMWNMKTPREKCDYMLNIPCIGNGGINKFYTIFADNKNLSIDERVVIMENEFFKTHM